jgi:spermidine dehydrogenase
MSAAADRRHPRDIQGTNMMKRTRKSKKDKGQVGTEASQHGDRALGMNARICRRDFLNSTLLASGSALLESLTPLELLGQQRDWGGYTGEGDYAGANGQTQEVMLAAHAVRDGVFDSPSTPAVDTDEVFDLVIVGGGISGLASALYFQDQAKPNQTCLVLENHPIFGGQARRNEFIVDGHRLMAPQGSNMCGLPGPGLVGELYTRIGAKTHEFKYQEWGGPPPAMPLGRTSYDHFRKFPSVASFGFWFGPKFGQQPGRWVVDPWNNLDQLPLSPELRSDFAKFLKLVNEWNQSPRHETQEELRRYDNVTIESIVTERYGLSREFARLFIASNIAAGYGVGPDALTGYWYRLIFGLGPDTTPGYSFPGGNTGVARHIVKTLIPDVIPGPRTTEAVCRNRINFGTLDRLRNQVRIRLRSTVVRVEHEGEPEKSSYVRVMYTRDGKVYRLKARAVIMAGGGWITKHLVRDLPSTHRQAYDQFNYNATLVANVAVRNWRFLHKLGLSGGRWFEGFGYWTEVRAIATIGADSPTIGPDSPTVLSLIVPFFYPGLPLAEQCSKGRAELLSTPFREYERKIREQFTDMFSGSGFDARRDIAGIILNRWGHHYVVAQPGFTWGEEGKPAPRDILRRAPFGRIAFANTDLGAVSGHVMAIEEAHRAVGQLLPVL